MGRQPRGSVARGGWGAVLLAAGLLLGLTAQADTVVPLVTPNTTITLTNPTAKTVTGNVEFNQMGIQRGNGTKTAYSLAAFEQKTVPSPVTDPNILNSQHATIEPDVDPSTGAKFPDPSVTAFDCDSGNGHNVPVWTLDQINSTQPLAGILQTGQEWILLATGDQAWTTSYSFAARGPDASGPLLTTTPVGLPPMTVSIGRIDGLLNMTYPRNSSIEQHYLDNGSQGFSALLYTDPASLDTRIEEMKKYTIPTDPVSVARAYVEKWLPKNGWYFFLSNRESRALINGDGHGTRSYSLDLAQILVRSPANTNGTTVEQMNQWILDQADGNLPNGELYHAYDPALWDNHILGNAAWVFYGEPSGGLAEIPLAESDELVLYDLIKGDFLLRYVMNNPDQYGGNATTGPDMNFNPTWNWQDPN